MDDLPNILPRYYKYMYLFVEEDKRAALPKHQPWDHEIKLELRKVPTFKLIYALAEKELKVLRKYILENLKKGFI